jgi:exodeoxyribonuclease V beta subunit
LIVCQKTKDSTFKALGLKECEIGGVEFEVMSEEVKESKPFVYESLRVGPQKESKTKVKEQKDDIKAINFGLALHYMLEVLDAFDKSSLEQAYWAMKNRYEFLLLDGECERIKKRVERLLGHKEFLELVDGNISKEQPVSYGGELKQLDLLVEKDDKLIIIDYKSSNSMQNAHIKQVAYYKEAIESISSKDTKGYLCYVREDSVEIVKV